jgi:hemerythrin-like domain-containing protein
MDDHALIGDLIYRIREAVRSGRTPQTVALVEQLASAFERHTFEEEAGLFAQMTDAGEAVDEVLSLVSDHRRLRPALRDPSLVVAHPATLLSLLDAITAHAEIEDNDLFPFALQQLPNERWAALAR